MPRMHEIRADWRGGGRLRGGPHRAFFSARTRAAFSLVELLAVLAIIAVIVGVAMRGGGSAAVVESPTGSMEVVAALVDLASRTALEGRTHARLLLDTDPSSEGFLRRLAVVRQVSGPNGETRWVRDGGSRYLPDRQFAHLEFWAGARPMRFDFSAGESFSGTESGTECLFFEFGPHGGTVAPETQPVLRMVFVSGIMKGTPARRELLVPETRSDNRAGLILRRWGGVLRITGPEEITRT